MLNHLGLLTAYQSIASWVEFVRTKGRWLQGLRRTLATFLLSLHTVFLLHQQSSFPTGPSVQKLFSVFLIDFLSCSLEGTIILQCPFPHTSRKRFYILVFRGNQYGMWDLWTLLYKQLLPYLVQHPSFVCPSPISPLGEVRPLHSGVSLSLLNLNLFPS